MDYIFAILMAVIAYSCISAGFVLQKLGIDWIGWKEKKDKRFYKNLFLWIAGFLLMNLYGVPSAVALKQLPPHIVAAFAGWGIILLVFLSNWLLKEKLHKTDFIYSFLIVAGIVLLNVFETGGSTGTAASTGIIILASVPAVLFIAGFIPGTSPKIKTFLYAAISGMTAGLMVVSLKLLVQEYGYVIAQYFNSPYLYLYTAAALLSFISLQVACKNGPMLIIGPVQYSGTIIYPVLAAAIVFGQWIAPLQIAAIAIIVFSVVNILRKH